jgi:glycosyltransferase involved in cell wall biosynthesis
MSLHFKNMPELKPKLKPGSKTACMFVYNSFENDSRVLKEASTLVAEGYQVHIIALWKKGLARLEKQHNILVHRLDNIPIHIRLIGQKKLERLKKLVYGQPHPAPVAGAITGPDTAINSATDPAGGTKKGGTPSFNPYQKTRLSFIKFLASTIKKILFYSNFYIETDKYLKKRGIKADVYHCHDLNTLYIGQKLAKKHKACLVYDSHELYVYRNRPYIPPKIFHKKEEAFERKYIQRADAVITVSTSIAGYLEKKYNIAKPHLIMNAPKKNKSPGGLNYSLRKELNLNDKQKILLYSGGITFSRGLDRVIESLTEMEDMFFVMMGYGQEGFKNYLKTVAVNHGVSHRMAFYGPVPSEKVTAWTASADLGIAPIENVCLSYYYCAPNKIFEYIQGGLPVVASNFPDLKNIVEKNDIGLTCDISDPKKIAKAVDQVLNKYTVYLNNVEKIKNRYCWENEEIKLMELYKNLFAGK